jgi:pyridoxal phosphate enzyme (YggS family)
VSTDTARADELGAGLCAVRERIARACAAAGRDSGEITLVVVTKTFPAQDVRLLAGLGVTDVAENRDQEAGPKREACADLPLRWHFVGQVQTNKAASVVRHADVIHAVDRIRLVHALGRGAVRAARQVEVLMQVSLDEPGAAGRGGADATDVPALAAEVAATEGLRLRGVMAVAPRGADPRAAFQRLAEVAAAVRRDHPDAGWISAGMSGDLEAAVEAGATHLRVGTAILGSRPPLR